METSRPNSYQAVPPPFDRECEVALARINEVSSPSITADGIPALRSRLRLLVPSPSNDELAREGRFTVEERIVPGPAGAPDIELLICQPTSVTTRRPAIYHTHGGGMIAGDNRTSLDELLDWAEALGLVVVSVDYRLAPETPHPGPAEDCYAGLSWVATHAEEVGVDPSRIIVAGASAGGGLAAAVAFMARDRGGPALFGQLLMSPMLDDRNDTYSSHQMAGLGRWDRTSNDTGWTALLGEDRGGPDVSSYAAPARASDLSRLPPAFIDVGSAETFRDEDVTFASRIWQAGGVAELHVWPGGFHGYSTMAPEAQISRDTRDARVSWLRRLLTG